MASAPPIDAEGGDSNDPGGNSQFGRSKILRRRGGGDFLAPIAPNSVEILKDAMLEAQKTMQLRMEEMQEQTRKLMEEIARQQGESAGNLKKKIALLEEEMSKAQEETLKRTLGVVEERLENQARTTESLQETLTDVIVPALDKTKEVEQQKEDLSHLKDNVSKIDTQMRGALHVLMRELQTLQGGGIQGKAGLTPGVSQESSVTRKDLDQLMSALSHKIDEVHKDVSRSQGGVVQPRVAEPACVETPIPKVPVLSACVEVPAKPACVPGEAKVGGKPGEGPTAPSPGFRLTDPSKEEVRQPHAANLARTAYVLGPSVVQGPNLRGNGGPDTCHVCPVGVGDGVSSTGDSFPMLMNPVMHQLVKNLKMPMFDDTVEGWASFMWDFQDYLEKVSPQEEIPDSVRLRLFEDAMPPTLQLEIKLMRKYGGGVLRFAEVLAKFEARYGSGGDSKMRKKWSEVSLPTAGKISTRQLREFQFNFLACAMEVKDASVHEVRRLVMQKIPPYMRNWVVEREQKNERQKPMFQLLGPEGMSSEVAKESLQALIQEPIIAAEALGNGVYRVQLNSEQAGKKLLALHMRNLEGTSRPFQVSLLEQHLPILELFELLHQKISNKEKADAYQNQWEKSSNTRVVDIEDAAKTLKKPKEKVQFAVSSVPPMASVAPQPSAKPQTFLAGFDGGGSVPPKPQNVIYPFRSSWRKPLAPRNPVPAGGTGAQMAAAGGGGYPYTIGPPHARKYQVGGYPAVPGGGG